MNVLIINMWHSGMLHYTSQLANALSEIPALNITTIIPYHVDSTLFNQKVRLKRIFVPFKISRKMFFTLIFQPINLIYMILSVFFLKPDIIHINSGHPWLFIAIPIFSKFFPIAVTLHDPQPHPGEDSFRKRFKIKISIHYASKLFVHGEKIKKSVVSNFFVAPSKIVAIPHGDYSFFLRIGKLQPENPYTVLFFGRILRYKGLEYFIKAAETVARQIPQAKFVIAGEGDLVPYRDLIQQGTACFEIHNRYLEEKEIPLFFSNAAVIVLPYIEGSQTGIIPIAYAFKKAVIATEVGSFSEVVDHNSTGIIIPPRNSEKLAQAIISLLNDEGKRKQLGEAGYKKMQAELNWHDIALKTESAYKECIKRDYFDE